MELTVPVHVNTPNSICITSKITTDDLLPVEETPEVVRAAVEEEASPGAGAASAAAAAPEPPMAPRIVVDGVASGEEEPPEEAGRWSESLLGRRGCLPSRVILGPLCSPWGSVV